jgi:hypothetical protein
MEPKGCNRFLTEEEKQCENIKGLGFQFDSHFYRLSSAYYVMTDGATVGIDFSAIDPEKYLSYAIEKIYEAGKERGKTEAIARIKSALRLNNN